MNLVRILSNKVLANVKVHITEAVLMHQSTYTCINAARRHCTNAVSFAVKHHISN